MDAMTVQADLERRLRTSGLRLTVPRRRILAVLEERGHATPEEIAAALAERSADGAATAVSTVYRNLEALTEAGLLRHTHLDHLAPSYHLVDHGVHLHLVCTSCGSVSEAAVEEAAEFVARLRAEHGFTADLTHTGLRGRCAGCTRPEEETR